MSFYNNYFSLGDVVASGLRPRKSDIYNTKKALGGLGYFDGAPDRKPDRDLFKGIKSFQKDTGLKVDGVMNPGGPTEHRLNAALNDNRLGDALFAKADKTHEKKSPWFETAKLPGIPGESVSSNARTLDAFLKHGGNGTLPRYQADALANGKNRKFAIGEYGDFLRQMHKRAPDRVKDFEKDVMDRLPESARTVLQSYITPAAEPIPGGKPKPKRSREPSPVASLMQLTLGLPAMSGEVASSNARMVRAARKTSDHANLARLHASAIREFGDKALFEVADFHDQLLAEDKETHASWWRAFEMESPDLAKELMAPLEDDEEPDEPAPDEPAPDEPAPDEPAPDEPAPDDPDPDEPDPDEPKPDEPKPSCTLEKLRLRELNVKIMAVGTRVSGLRMRVHNKKIEIEQKEAIIKEWEDRGLIGTLSGSLSRSGNPIVKGIGIIGEAAGAPSGLKILKTHEELKGLRAELQKLEEELAPLENELMNLEAEYAFAEEELARCEAGGKEDGDED